MLRGTLLVVGAASPVLLSVSSGRIAGSLVTTSSRGSAAAVENGVDAGVADRDVAVVAGESVAPPMATPALRSNGVVDTSRAGTQPSLEPPNALAGRISPPPLPVGGADWVWPNCGPGTGWSAGAPLG